MAGDSAIRSLLEKMAQSASSAYLSILERYNSLDLLQLVKNLITHYLPNFLFIKWIYFNGQCYQLIIG